MNNTRANKANRPILLGTYRRLYILILKEVYIVKRELFILL